MNIKECANNFVKAFCDHVYNYYQDYVLDGQSEYIGYIDGWTENRFKISIYEKSDGFCCDLYGLSKVNYSEETDVDYLINLKPGATYKHDYLLKVFIQCINSKGYVPDRVEIECRHDRVTSLKIIKYTKDKDIEKVLI